MYVVETLVTIRHKYARHSHAASWRAVDSRDPEETGCDFDGLAEFPCLPDAKSFIEDRLLEAVDYQSFRIKCPDGSLVIPYAKDWLILAD